jgi:ubiquinone/menaquinone biosynthesis C-methylase UbiE
VIVRERLAAAPEGNLLDLGGGTGWATDDLLGARATQAAVAEPSARARRAGKRRRPHLSFVEASAEALPFPDGFFAKAVAIVSFHHFGDPEGALRELRRVLTPGGVAAFVEYLPGRSPHRFHGRRMGAPRFWPPEDLSALLGSAGFDAVDSKAVGPLYVVLAHRP